MNLKNIFIKTRTMIVYKATNKINGKIYIGQTILKLNNRISNHKSTSKRLFGTKEASAFNNAMHKYGAENFEWEIIECCSSSSDLNDSEIFWINWYDSTNPKIGYNISKGGQDCKEIGQKALSDLWKTDEFREKMKQATRKGARKLTDEQVRLIKKTYEIGFMPQVLAEYFGISNSGIQAVLYNHSWKEFEPVDCIDQEIIDKLNNIKNDLNIKRKENRKRINIKRKLSNKDISKIKYLKSIGITHTVCAEYFNISKSLASKIFLNRFPEILPCEINDISAKEIAECIILVKRNKEKSIEKQKLINSLKIKIVETHKTCSKCGKYDVVENFSKGYICKTCSAKYFHDRHIALKKNK
jgi:group I intron endonuclease